VRHVPTDYPQVRRLTDAAALRARLADLGTELPAAGGGGGVPTALGEPLQLRCGRLHNRWAVLPMEGWDGTADGRPTDLVRRRWERFGRSGAALVWGGEAVAVAPEGRANPNQLCIGPHSAGDLASLRQLLVDAHRRSTDGAEPVVGLQLTHSGRWSRPAGTPAPRTAYRHPLLDARVGADERSVLSDAELDDLVAAMVRAATVAAEAGYDFVDVKHCHGYLLHELLTARDRPGPYGGDLAGRTRFLTEAVRGIRAEAPGLGIGVRLSAFDLAPHRPGPDGIGEPEAAGSYPWAFGGDGTGSGVDLSETHDVCRRLTDLGVELLCVTAGSPYYVPHVQRPAYFPPGDGYRPPRDPLVEVARLCEVTRELTTAHPDLVVVGSGLTYLQEHLPAVAEGLVAEGWMHVAGLGRMMLSDPDLPARVLRGEPLDRRLVCRTFSDCTTAPRNGLVSGCYPLDDFYRERPERRELAAVKRRLRSPGAPAGTDEGAAP
jgi:2,4-dienoyl-CoA reductase-like NADH-dependent reductase (Old Yellow Enzyme family)